MSNGPFNRNCRVIVKKAPITKILLFISKHFHFFSKRSCERTQQFDKNCKKIAKRDESQDKTLGELQEAVSNTVSGIDELGTRHANLESFLNTKPVESRKKTENWLKEIGYLVRQTTEDNSKIAEWMTKAEVLIQTGNEPCNDGEEESLAEAKSLAQRTMKENSLVVSKLVGTRKLVNDAIEDIYKKGKHRLAGIESSVRSETDECCNGFRRLKALVSKSQKAKEAHENNARRLTNIESDFHLPQQHMDTVTNVGIPMPYDSPQRSIDSS